MSTTISVDSRLHSSDESQQMQTADTVAADPATVSKNLSPTAPIFVPTRQDPKPADPSIVHKNLLATAPVFIPAGENPTPSPPTVISKGLSATAPVFIPSCQNTVPYLLCEVETDRSLRRDKCLGQILEQYKFARQVEMDARRQHFDYGLEWIQTPDDVIGEW